MNRLIWTGTGPLPDSPGDHLPPPLRGPGGPARVLFIHTRQLGFGTTTESLQRYCESRGDIDAVHLSLPLPFWSRVIAKELPKWLHGLDLHNTRMTWAYSRDAERVLKHGFPPEHFDVVHIMTRERAGCVQHRKTGPGQPRYVVNVDATLESWDRSFEITRWAPPIDRAMDRRILLAADAVAFASRWAMDSAIDAYGLPRERCILHMPCVPTLDVACEDRTDESRRESDGPLRMIFIGNAWERKGGPRLLRWHQSRWKDRCELHICSSAAPVDVSARGVTWHGRVPHERLVRELLPRMDLCVIPTFEDTFLIAAQEAQAAGVPVVSSKLAGIPEVVREGETGLLVDRHDEEGFIRAAERLLSDEGLRTQMGRRARVHVERNLNAAVWHNHLLDQLIAIAGGRAIQTEPDAPRHVETGEQS